VSFSKKSEINISDLNTHYIQSQGRNQKNHITVKHHYHFDIFNTNINFQLQELDNRFGEKAMELLTLNFALNKKNWFISFSKLTIYVSLRRSIILLIFLSGRKLI
jgi:hypothetical protein